MLWTYLWTCRENATVAVGVLCGREVRVVFEQVPNKVWGQAQVMRKRCKCEFLYQDMSVGVLTVVAVIVCVPRFVLTCLGRRRHPRFIQLLMAHRSARAGQGREGELAKEKKMAWCSLYYLGA